jgi:glutamate-1-semialdehyde 2,1-aminomutase
MAALHGLARDRISALKRREDERFAAGRPRSRELVERGRALMPYGVPTSWMATLWDHPPVFVAEGHGASFVDVDGHEYLDFHIADTSAFCGHAPEPVTRAVAEQVARGAQFQLPTEDALWVAAELAGRWGLPRWQFTLSATTANVEAIRLARHVTGRETVVMFDGKYHGHADDTLVILSDGGPVPSTSASPVMCRAEPGSFSSTTSRGWRPRSLPATSPARWPSRR